MNNCLATKLCLIELQLGVSWTVSVRRVEIKRGRLKL